MRQERTVQVSIFDLFAGHEIGRELRAISGWLDGHRELASLVAADRQGLPAEAVLCCALLKQYRQLSYQELAFRLEDSASFRAFARLPHGWSPQKSVLHRTISAIRAETWEQINRTLLTSARETKLERGRVVRLDSTVTAAPVHEPSDSSLLVGRGAGDGAPAAAGDGAARPGGARVARSSSGGEEARPGHPVHPWSTPPGSAVPRADQNHASPP
jgi:IS5 family transposase